MNLSPRTETEDFVYFEASEPAHYEAAGSLIRAYIADLGADLGFQSVEAEMANLPAMYSGKDGCLLLCRSGKGPYTGMVALRQKGAATCEMKRLYVKPAYQGHGIGRQLAEQIIEKARQMGFETMVLDTLERLQPAIRLYTQLGFERTGAYYSNPLEGVVYMRRQLPAVETPPAPR